MSLLEEFYELRAKRLALQHQADVLEQQEKDILYELTKDLDPAKAEYKYSLSGFNFKTTRKTVPKVNSWDETLQYIRAEAAVDLLQKRLTESAVIARWDNGVTVPGIEKTVKWPVVISKDAETP